MDTTIAALRLFAQKVEEFDEEVLRLYAQGLLPCNPALTEKLAKLSVEEICRRSKVNVLQPKNQKSVN
jgi:type II secretory pathway predicted ATPase ExeA